MKYQDFPIKDTYHFYLSHCEDIIVVRALMRYFVECRIIDGNYEKRRCIYAIIYGDTLFTYKDKKSSDEILVVYTQLKTQLLFYTFECH